MRSSTIHRLRSLRAAGRRRGFTMVELLAVVAMIGILSVVAVTGYRKYLNTAKVADAKAIMSSIRVSEENYRAETLVYLDCSGALNGDYYPGPANGRIRHWIQPTHADFANWRQLNVATDTPTQWAFTVIAGPAGVAPTAAETATNPNFGTPTEPWYVVQAKGNTDGDAIEAILLSSSFSGSIYAENEGE